jgi:sulfite reductase (NADPH) hemoprotein beta-component
MVDHGEVERFADALQGFLDGRIDAERFTAMRLQQGVYGQRQEGVNMVRIKLPGGRLNARQLNAIAEGLDTYAEHDVVHITTRQDIQMHHVPLARVPLLLRELAQVGLTTREACGNTIRNITACPMAGVCPREHVDVTRHLDGAVMHFLRNPLNQQMPRKFKISLSGCESDCSQAMMHDLGIVAVRQGTRFGFKVTAGGGLGHKPHEAIVIEPFIEEKELLLVMEAVVALHNRYSDRTKRAKSRIKFLVDKFGPQGFIEKYREELARVTAALASKEYPRGDWFGGVDTQAPGPGAPRAPFAQKQPGLMVLPISVPLGNLTAVQLRGVAALVADEQLTDIRATQDQNLALFGVAKQRVEPIYARLQKLGLSAPKAGDNVVACPGTSTCRLGITSSTVLAPKLSGGPSDLRIRVSGCHNGCAQPETGDIGIYGEGRRLHGKLIPHYQTYFGGDGMTGGALAIKGPSLPTARIELAIERVQRTYADTRSPGESFFAWTRRQPKDFFHQLLGDLSAVAAEDVPQLVRDHGEGGDFKVLQLGGGECAGASQVKIGSSFFDAAHERGYRDALKFQRKYAEAANCAEAIARLIGQGVVQLVGGKIQEDLPELALELASVLPTVPQLGADLKRFASELARPPEQLTEQTLNSLFEELDAWTIAAAQFCVGFDRQLDLTEALPVKVRAQPLNFHRVVREVQESAV